MISRYCGHGEEGTLRVLQATTEHFSEASSCSSSNACGVARTIRSHADSVVSDGALLSPHENNLWDSLMAANTGLLWASHMWSLILSLVVVCVSSIVIFPLSRQDDKAEEHSAQMHVPVAPQSRWSGEVIVV